MWTESADDRSFLRELSRDIVAATAAAELDDFDALIAPYFANPGPPRVTVLRGTPTLISRPDQRHISPVAPAVVGAVLNRLVREIHTVAQHNLPEVVKPGLKRLFRRRGAHPNERAWIRSSHGGRGRVLALIIYIYTLPVPATVALSEIDELADSTARIYGLDEARAAALASAVIARLYAVPHKPECDE